MAYNLSNKAETSSEGLVKIKEGHEVVGSAVLPQLPKVPNLVTDDVVFSGNQEEPQMKTYLSTDLYGLQNHSQTMTRRTPVKPRDTINSEEQILPAGFLDELQAKANLVFPTRRANSESVFALLLAWEDQSGSGEYPHISDMHKMHEILGGKLGFRVKQFQIPSQKSEANLLAKLAEVKIPCEERGLLIVYYTGNGRLTKEGLILMGSPASSGEVSWSTIEAKLLGLSCDIFAIFDSCYICHHDLASTNAKTFEVIAACSQESRATVGSTSLSAGLIKILPTFENKTFTVKELYARLVTDGGVGQPPLRRRHGAPRSIAISALKPLEPDVRKPREVAMTISIARPLGDADLYAWCTWIESAPANLDRMEMFHHSSDPHQNSRKFVLRIRLQDSMIPDTKTWMRWIEHLPDSLQSIDVTFAPMDPHDGTDAVATFVKELNISSEMTEALKRIHYRNVTVLPIMWGYPEETEVPDLPYTALTRELSQIKQELLDLGKVFRERFNFEVEPLWQIPHKSECQQLLRRRIQDFADNHDNSNELVIIIYGGHGLETRLSAEKEQKYGYNPTWAGHSMWAANTSDYTEIVDWTLLQGIIEDANCDSLTILDCCHAGNAARSTQTSTNEILGACAPSEVSYFGVRAYSKMVKKKLENMPTPLTVFDLHEELLKESRKPLNNENYDALVVAPVRGFGRRGGSRTITLQPLPRLQTINDKPDSMAINSGTKTKANPHIFMEIELDQSQSFNVLEWEKWFKQRPTPPSMFGVKFYTAEEIHMKMIIEKAAEQLRSTDLSLFPSDSW